MVYRILDANFNRLREGLRVIEEAARFLLNDGETFALVKGMRHRLLKMLDGVPGGLNALVSARDSAGDVGAESKLPTEMSRANYLEVVTAGLKRVQEAARVIEEYGKIVDRGLSASAKSLRFQAYRLEKKLLPRIRTVSEKNRDNLDVSVYFITGDKFSRGKALARVVYEAIQGGATVIQLREKDFTARRLIDVGRQIREITQQHNVAFIVNDRVDVALAVDADGVHLGQDDLPVWVARRILGPEKLVGVSTHSLEQALQAQKDGADYIGVGPVFETHTKYDVCPTVGLELVKEVSLKVTIPKVAIGGIKAHNVEEAVAAGADGVAVITAIAAAPDPEQAARELKEAVLKARNLL